MAEHILVTGGAGYLGSTMVPMLLDAGYRVTVVDNFMFRQSSLNQLCHDPDFNVVRADVRSEQDMRPLYAKADAIVPLAAYVGAPLCKADPVGAKTVNYDAVLTMLDSVSPEQLILMPTTNSAYGTGDENNFCTEESPLRPISTYAIDKVEVEKRLMERTNSISFRLATVFGMSPRMRLDLLVNDFTWRAVNDRFLVLFEGHFKRNYIHVRDVARVFLHGLSNRDAMKGQIYNVGLSDANLSKMELCEAIKRQLPDFYFVEADIGKDPDQRNYIVSNEKIEATGYAPAVSIDTGIAELVKGFRMIRNSVHGNV
jgi:nucleoside-diphosphate-sugar epimerase